MATNVSSPILNSNAKIINGDITTVLSSIDKGLLFDVIIADPPYNIGKDFGNNSDSLDLKDYLKWSRKWIDICLKHLKDDGIMYIYGFTEILARIASIYPLDKQRFLIWHYTNKTTPRSKFWQRSHEAILCLWKDEKPKLQIDQIREPYSEQFLKFEGKKRASTKGRFGQKETVYNLHKNGALPRDVIKIPALAGGAGLVKCFYCKNCNAFLETKEKKYHKNCDIVEHPTQKPAELTKRLILSKIDVDNKDSKILIPFAGSGSECIVAKELGIDYLGIEINPDYVRYAEKWFETLE